MPKTQIERLWTIGSGLAALILVVVGYLYFISPQRSQTSDVNARVATARQQNDSLAARISALSAQNRNLATYQKAVAQAGAALPSTSGLPDFLRTLQALGNATLTDVSMLTAGTPTPYIKPGATASAAPSATSTPSAAPTAAPVAPTASIYLLPLTAQVTGSAPHLSEFLRQLQSVQPRAVLITQITQTSTGLTGGPSAGATSGTSSIQLTMDVFLRPAGAVAALPTGNP